MRIAATQQLSGINFDVCQHGHSRDYYLSKQRKPLRPVYWGCVYDTKLLNNENTYGCVLMRT